VENGVRPVGPVVPLGTGGTQGGRIGASLLSARWWLTASASQGPLDCSLWGCVHASGLHSTIAGVVVGFTVPAVARA